MNEITTVTFGDFCNTRRRKTTINIERTTSNVENADSTIIRHFYDNGADQAISTTSVNCQTCKKIIQEEYIEKQLGDTTIYFCCKMCEKYFVYDEHIEERKRLQLEDMQLVCQECGFKKPLPTHCNRPMHYETIDGKDKLVCWMGSECGVIDIPLHCGKPMELQSKTN